MRASFLTRLKKLEALSNKKGRYPGVLIVYRQPDGSLTNAEGEPVNDTDFFGLLVILYSSDEEWEAAAMAQQSQPAQQEQPVQPVPVKAEPTADEIKAAKAAATEAKINKQFEDAIAKRRAQRQNRGRYNWK